MTRKKSDITATPGIHLLKDHIAQMDSAIKHLHGLVGAEINALDRNFNIKGKKPVKQPVSHVQSKSLLQQLASPSLFKGLFSAAFGGDSSGATGQQSGSSFRMSQGQVRADAASAISRAMKRNL